MNDPPLPRDEFPVTKSWCYLNHAADGPLSKSAARAVTEVTTSVLGEGGLAYQRYEEHADQVRSSAATLLGVPTADVAFVKNTTEGLGFVASGLDWHAGERVLVPRHEFPSNLYPWLALQDRGVRVDLLEPDPTTGSVPLETFAAALAQGGARVVAVSWVQYACGWRIDLESLAALCHEYDALLCVDAVQGIGCLPTRLASWGVDVAAASGFKWMLAPMGVGLLYVAPNRRDELRPLEPGWNSVSDRDDYHPQRLDLDDSARRFEGGSLDLAAIAGLGAALDLHLAAGPDEVWAHIEGLTRLAAKGLDDLGATILSDRAADARSGIVTFAIDGLAPDEGCARLLEDGVVCAPRGGGIRLSPHGYNDADDIERFLAAVGELVPERPAPAPAAPPPAQGPMRRPTDW